MMGTAQAQQMPPMTWGAVYGELGYTFLKIDAFGTSFRPDAIRGILGYDFHPNFAFEGMYAGGVNDDNKTLSINGVPTTVQSKLDYMYGLWLKPKYVYAPYNSEAFARLGWAHTKAKLTQAGVSQSQSNDAFAYGLGVNYHINPNFYVGGDWMRYSNGGGHIAHIDGFTLSAGYHW
jgi:outer membrane autotransporter protein